MRIAQHNFRHITYFLYFFVSFLHAIDEGYKLPDIEEYQLDNGMRIIMSPNYNNPTISILLRVNVGLLDEPKEKPGLARRAYDNLLKGTQRYENLKEIKKKLSSLGSYYGDFDHYAIGSDYLEIGHTLLKQDTEESVGLFSEIVRRPTFNKSGGILNKYFDRIFYSIIPKFFIYTDAWQEIDRHFKYMFNGLFVPINTKSNSYTKKELKKWYFQYFRPENTILMISGDVNYLHLKKVIYEHFGDWRSNHPLTERRIYDINITNNSVKKVRFINNETMTTAALNIYMKTTEVGEFWDPAVQMALGVCYEIGHSRLEEIRKKMNYAGELYGGWEQSNRMPYTNISAFIEYSNLDKLYSELINEFNNLSNNTITKVELEKAKDWRINKNINQLYDPNTLNGHVLYYYSQNGYSLEKMEYMIDDIQAVTLEEVNAAAKKVFDPENFIMVVNANKDSCSTFLNQFENIEYYETKDEINK